MDGEHLCFTRSLYRSVLDLVIQLGINVSVCFDLNHTVITLVICLGLLEGVLLTQSLVFCYLQQVYLKADVKNSTVGQICHIESKIGNLFDMCRSHEKIIGFTFV